MGVGVHDIFRHTHLNLQMVNDHYPYKMAISLGVYPIFRHTHIYFSIKVGKVTHVENLKAGGAGGDYFAVGQVHGWNENIRAGWRIQKKKM